MAQLGVAAADRLAEVAAFEAPATAVTRRRELLCEDQHRAGDRGPGEDEQHEGEWKVPGHLRLVSARRALILRTRLEGPETDLSPLTRIASWASLRSC